MKLTRQQLRQLIRESMGMPQEFELTLDYDVRDAAWSRFAGEQHEDDVDDMYLKYTDSGQADDEGLAEIASILAPGARIHHHEPAFGGGNVSIRGTKQSLVDTAFNHHQAYSGGAISFSEADVLEFIKPV